MLKITQPKITPKKKLDLLLWLIELTERRRESTSNRAATVINADAFLIAGITFVLSYILTKINQLNFGESMAVFLGIGLTLICIVVSIILASLAAASVLKVETAFGGNAEHPLFNPFDTVSKFKNFESLEKDFNQHDDLEINTLALSELWTIENLFSKRYQNLRWALFLIDIGSIFFFISLVIVVLIVLKIV
jgi:hypothetical protein